MLTCAGKGAPCTPSPAPPGSENNTIVAAQIDGEG